MKRISQRLKQFFTAVIILVLSLCWVQAAFAHIEGGQAAGFLIGLQHPWSGLDHMLAMIAVGLWGAQLGSPALWILPIAFPMMMSMGAMMGLLGIPVPGIEVGIAFSAIILGAMILVEAQPKIGIAIVMVAVFAVVTLVAAFTVSLKKTWSRIVVRVAGSWVAAIGILMFGWAFQRLN